MSRSFDAADIVVLPILDVSSAITLGGAVLTVAQKVPKLPKAIQKGRDALAERHQALRAAAAERLGAAQQTDGTRSVRADRRLDGAWSALYTWLVGWAKLPESISQSAQAQTILGDLFAEGLKFLMHPYKQQWAESDTRLLRLKDQKHDVVIMNLGGQAFLDELQAAHGEYGEALGITKSKDQPDPGLNLRDALNAFRNALRAYVVRVSAHVDEEDPASEALAVKLLEPLIRWESPKTSGGREGEKGEATATSEGEATKVET